MNPQSLDKLATDHPELDAAGLLALCSLDKRTVKPVDGPAFRVWMSVDGKAIRLERTGDMLLQQYPVGHPAYPVVRANVDRLLVIVRYSYTGAPFDTTDRDFSAQAKDLSDTAVAYNAQDPTLGLTPTEVAELVALGGGYQVFDATLEDCAAARVRVARKAKWKALNTLRYVADSQRASKLNRLDISEDEIPDDLAGLDALALPEGGGGDGV